MKPISKIALGPLPSGGRGESLKKSAAHRSVQRLYQGMMMSDYFTTTFLLPMM